MSQATSEPAIALTMTLKDAGRMIGMSQPTLRKWIRAGVLRTIPSSPASARRKITRSELERFLERISN